MAPQRIQSLAYTDCRCILQNVFAHSIECAPFYRLLHILGIPRLRRYIECAEHIHVHVQCKCALVGIPHVHMHMCMYTCTCVYIHEHAPDVPGVAVAGAAVGGVEEVGREMGPGHTMPPEAAMA